MNPQAQVLNDVILSQNSVVYELLSEKGKSIFFPKKGILGQTADAKGSKINATIGAAIEDDMTPMRLKVIEDKIDLDPALVFPYAPSFGRPDIRSKWKEMIYDKNPSLGDKVLSLPVVTNALTHGISMMGYLFLDAGDEVISPSLFWGNYNLTLTQAYQAPITTFNLFKNDGFDVEALRAKLNDGVIGKKVLVLNFPNNPSGYTPTIEEMSLIVAVVKESAELGNKLVVVTDDAYFGLVYESGIARESIFVALSDLHENVLAVKVDGATKEDYVWGFRVGFMTYGIKGGTAELYDALEQKTAGAIRGNISNASNLSQSLLVQAFSSAEYAAQKIQKEAIMQQRYDAVKVALREEKYKDCFNALPYNSGYFMCVKLADGIDGEELRALLIRKYSIGVINLNNIIRIAFAAVSANDIKALFDGLYNACKELK